MKEYEVVVNGKTHRVMLKSRGREEIQFSVAGRDYSVAINSVAPLQSSAAPAPVAVRSPVQSTKVSRAGAKDIVAPMPGLVVQIAVKAGDEVKVGQVVAVIEAMKMENNIISQRAGVVSKVHVTQGKEVENGATLISF